MRSTILRMKALRMFGLALVMVNWGSVSGAQPGQPLWQFETGGGNSAPALAAEGTVYVGSRDNNVYALNGATGQKLWVFPTGNWVDSSPAIGADGTVYVGSFDNKVYALNGATGQKRWEFATGNWVHSSPAIASDGTVYIGSDDGNVYALNGATGQQLWAFRTGDLVTSSPAIGPDGTVYVGSYDNKVYALDGATGQRLWDFPTGGYVGCSPAIGPDGTVYIGSYDNKVYALDGATGQKRWEFATEGWVHSSAAIGSDGTVYVGSIDRKVYALDGSTGHELWEFLTGDNVYCSPAAVADGTVYIGSNDRKLYALDGATGVELWDFPTGSIVVAAPAIAANGTVYVVSRDNMVYALAGSGGLASSSWPKFRGDARNTGLADPQLVLIPPVHFVASQVMVTRLAGSGSAGFADGTGTNAQFNFPNGGFVDPAGNVFIADSSNHRIRKISAQGVVSTVAGTGAPGYADGAAASSQFSYPLGVCVDTAGHVFVADSGNNRIREVGLDGQVRTVAGSGQAGYQDGLGTNAVLNYPNDLVVDAAGNLFVTEFNNHTVRRISPDRTVSTWVGNGRAGYLDGPRAVAQLNQPGGIALDRAGDLYVTEWGGQRVRMISAAGEVSTVAGNGVAGYRDGAGPKAQFNNPDGAVVDGEGNLYVADNGNHVIRRIGADGVVETVAGTGVAGLADGQGSQAQFSHPAGLGLDSQGNVYVADGGNHSVRKLVIVKPVVITPEVVQRRLPAGYAPGCAVGVTLEAKPPAPTTIYEVQDHPPVGWSITAIGDGGSLDVANGLVKFGPFLDGQARSLTYAVVPPSDEQAIRQFTGTFSMNGVESAIGGDTELPPFPYQPTVHFRVIWNSALTETCLGCGRPPATYPLRGSAEMRFFSSIMGSTWTFSDIQMDTVNPGPPHYHITGSGTWSGTGQFSFPPYVILLLGLQVDDGTTNRLCAFYERDVGGAIPQQQMLHVGGPQINGTPQQTFSIALDLAPLQDLWFSTRRGLTRALTNVNPARVENGDVLSDSGRVVKGNAELLRPFGITSDPTGEGYDIDALSVAPGGEIVFSLRADLLSPTFGLLRHGDLLSNRGRIVKRNGELLQAFGVMPPVQDLGLDGVEIPGGSLTLFSIATNVYSEKLGTMLTSGDLLSDGGSILYSNQQLLAAFQPNPKEQNYGLAAFHCWGWPLISEVWFCTEKGFDSALGPILAGDLLSSRGYIVYRNLELVAQFRPIEDLTDFGLDGLFLVQEPLQENPVSRLTVARAPSGALLRWETTGRVSQVHRASSVNGPFSPVSPILPDLEWWDTGAWGTNSRAFYQLRVW
jgi:outer membrane protein assembly factor BamB/sugar lactone lactonase YvrE